MINNPPLLKSPKNQNRRAALGRPATKLLVCVCVCVGGGGGGGAGVRGGGGGLGASTSLRSTNLALSSALVPQTLSCWFAWKIPSS